MSDVNLNIGMESSTLVFDIETDGFEPSEIFVLGVLDFWTDEFKAYTSEEDNITEGIMRLAEAGCLIAHYGKGFDIPVIERLTGGLVTFDRSKVFDTYEVSRDMFPELPNHKLRTWGDILEFPKGEWTDFTKFSWEMVSYCEQDCRVTGKAAAFMLEELARRV
jgi:DNA polymerase-1